uniref:Uncharacterized protein n=1 Tax=Glossina austeni TaxID=7395 RepID=A0A1A9UP29_GLOAU
MADMLTSPNMLPPAVLQKLFRFNLVRVHFKSDVALTEYSNFNYDALSVGMLASFMRLRMKSLKKGQEEEVVYDLKCIFLKMGKLSKYLVAGTLRSISSNSTYSPQRIKFQHAHALLVPQVLYGLEVVVGTTAGNFLRLSRIINSMVRYVYGLRGRENGSEYLATFCMK